MIAAIRAKDEQTKRELEIEAAKAQERINKIEQDRAALQRQVENLQVHNHDDGSGMDDFIRFMMLLPFFL
jgi:hypothetical protein